MATSSVVVLESVNSDEMVEQGGAGSLKDLNTKDDLGDVEMSDGQSENVEEVEEGWTPMRLRARVMEWMGEGCLLQVLPVAF